MKLFVLVYLFVLLTLLDLVQSDALSLSISDMEPLVAREKILLDNMELYVGALKKKVETIQSNLDRMRAENEKALLDPEVYVMNPLQAFSLLRRLHSDWVNWKLYMEKSVGEGYVGMINKIRPTLPTEEDIHEATEGISRLQYTYGLNVLEMSTGKLNAVQYSAKLSPIDCFSIGSYLHKNTKYKQAALWFQAALNLFKDIDGMNEVLDFDKKKIYFSLAETYEKEGLFDRALQQLDDLLNIDPQDSNALSLKRKWELKMDANAKLPVPERNVTYNEQEKEMTLEVERYKEACQGKYPARVSNLYCLYNTTTDPFLKLAPFKMELISLDPYIVLFHDVISDHEIEVFKNLAKPKLVRSRVFSKYEQKGVPNSERTSKFSMFHDNFNPELKRFNQRIADMTGFELRASEQLQVISYGLGGHFGRHHDYYPMSDVEQGGATAFVNLKLAVFPIKGACIFWYNLDMKGDGIENTLHAACPVIVGSKWVATKWISDEEQVLRRPCWRQ